MIHQAGGVGTGSLRSDWVSGKFKSTFNDARLRKSRRPLQNQKQQHKQRQGSRPDVGATERNVNGTELDWSLQNQNLGPGIFLPLRMKRFLECVPPPIFSLGDAAVAL